MNPLGIEYADRMFYSAPPPPAVLSPKTSGRIFRLPLPFEITREEHRKRYGLLVEYYDCKRFEVLAEGILRLVNLCSDRNIDTAFFLDRSARPAYVMFREAWKLLLPEQKPPLVKFINVGRNNGRVIPGYGMVEQLRDKYRVNDCVRILVADEFSESGGTLYRAVDLVKRMYPLAEVIPTGIFKDLPEWWGRMGTLMGLFEHSGGVRAETFLSRRDTIPESGKINKFRNQLTNFAGRVALDVQGYPPGSFDVETLRPWHERRAYSGS